MWMRKKWPLWEIIYTGLKKTGLNSWYVKTMGVHRGIRTGICPFLEIGTKNQNFLENVMSAAPFRLIDLFVAMIVYQPVRHSRCTRARFTVLVSCSGEELAVHSFPLLSLQRHVAKLARGLLYCWPLLCNNNMATNLPIFTSSYDIKRFSAPASCDCWAQTGNDSRQWLLIAALPPDLTKEGQRGQRCHFHIVSIISNFVVDEHWNTFPIVFFIIFEVNIVVEQQKA